MLMTNYMKKLTINNDKIFNVLKEKDDISKELKAMAEEEKKTQEKANKMIAKLQRLDEKVRPEINRENEKIEKNEFEQLSRVLIEEDKLIFEVVDRLSEWKDSYKKAIEEAKEKK